MSAVMLSFCTDEKGKETQVCPRPIHVVLNGCTAALTAKSHQPCSRVSAVAPYGCRDFHVIGCDAADHIISTAKFFTLQGKTAPRTSRASALPQQQTVFLSPMYPRLVGQIAEKNSGLKVLSGSHT